MNFPAMEEWMSIFHWTAILAVAIFLHQAMKFGRLGSGARQGPDLQGF